MLRKSILFLTNSPGTKSGEVKSGEVKQCANKSLFSSAKETAIFKADSIKVNGCYLEELLCLHFKGPVLLLD